MTTSQQRRNQRLALIGVNSALLMGLAAVTFGPSADAQSRPRGSYTMVAGGVPGASANAIYIVDMTSEELIALVYDHNEKKLDGVGYRSLPRDTQTMARGSGR